MGMREEVLKLAEECGCQVYERYGEANAFYRGQPVTNLLTRFYKAATLQAAEQMKEEAAKIEKVLAKSPAFFAKWGEWESYKKGVSEYRNEIRAIDVNKLFENNCGNMSHNQH